MKKIDFGQEKDSKPGTRRGPGSIRESKKHRKKRGSKKNGGGSYLWIWGGLSEEEGLD